jgi:hypothetical protein
MSQNPISELRRRMLEDMAVRKFSEATSRHSIRHIAEFAKFLDRSPDTATAEDVRRFQVYMTECGAKPPKLNSATCALRFFFGTTLDRAELGVVAASDSVRGPDTGRAFTRGGRLPQRRRDLGSSTRRRSA